LGPLCQRSAKVNSFLPLGKLTFGDPFQDSGVEPYARPEGWQSQKSTPLRVTVNLWQLVQDPVHTFPCCVNFLLVLMCQLLTDVSTCDSKLRSKVVVTDLGEEYRLSDEGQFRQPEPVFGVHARSQVRISNATFRFKSVSW
jgi:hypothetical protein